MKRILSINKKWYLHINVGFLLIDSLPMKVKKASLGNYKERKNPNQIGTVVQIEY
jgi:hypothetical protein